MASYENRRQGGARNLGLKHAKGRYIGFMDADDWADPEMFERMLKKADETGADVVGVDLCRVYEHTMNKGKHEICNTEAQTGIIDDEKRKLLLINMGPVVTKIYDRHFFFDPEFKFCENIAYEDNAATAELVMRYRHFEIVNDTPLYYYYQVNDSTTHSVSKRSCEHRMEAMRLMLSDARNNGALAQFKEAIEYKFANLFYQGTLFSYMLSDLHKEYRFIDSLGKEMKSTFPNFMENRYFVEKTNPEEMKLMRLQQKSTALFLIYFSLKKAYRMIRYKRW